jgi:GrpB-like predicted nucleotidyltransferase (UPF0157 family)
MPSPVIGPYTKEPPDCHDWDPLAPAAAAFVADLITARAPWVKPEHIGSSSVPGTAGKGIIDLLVPVPSARLDELKDILEDLGFQHQTGPNIWPEDRPMRTGSVEYNGKTYQLHVHVIQDHEPEVGALRRFRDQLRADPALRDEYVAVKRAIIEAGTTDRYAYTLAKSQWFERYLADHATDRSTTAGVIRDEA